MTTKKIISLLAALLLLAGCETIPENRQLIPLPASEWKSRALLIEFTGFLCSNCPTAAQEAEQLKQAYGDALTVVAAHPADNAFTQTAIPAYDFTCDAANEIYRYVGGTATTPFPTGVLGLQGPFLSYSEWSTAILHSVLQDKGGHVGLQITAADTTLRSVALTLTAQATPTAAIATGEVRVLQALLLLVEDSIIGPQVEGKADGSVVERTDYVHRHMLRAALAEDDPWSSLFTCQVGGTPETRDYICEIPAGNAARPIRMAHCAIVAVLLDAETREVLDVETKKI